MLHGIFPALLTPFSADGCSIELEKIQPLCDALLADGVDGFFVCGTTGEAPYLTADEKIAVLTEAVRAVNGRGKILAQVGCGDWPSTLKVVRAVRQIGVDAVSLLQPWFFRYDDEAQYQYIARVAEALDGFPLYLYNLPIFTNNNLEPATLEKLCKRFPNIQGLKESGSPELIQRWYPYQSSQFQVICGNDTQMYRTLCQGGNAVVASTANVLPKTFRALIDAIRASQWEEAERQQEKINQYVDVILGPNSIAIIKASMAMKGLDAGYVRPPCRNLSEDELTQLRKDLQRLDIIPCAENN